MIAPGTAESTVILFGPTDTTNLFTTEPAIPTFVIDTLSPSAYECSD